MLASRVDLASNHQDFIYAVSGEISISLENILKTGCYML